MSALSELNKQVWHAAEAVAGLRGPVAIYAGLAGLGLVLLLLYFLLHYFGYGHQPGLGRSAFGGATLAYDGLGALWPAAVGAGVCGLAGLVGVVRDWAPLPTAVGALFAAAAAVVSCARIPRWLRETSDAAGRVKDLVGKTGLVAVDVPAEHGGEGVVVLHYRKRNARYLAVTVGLALLAGTQVRVTAIREDGVLEIEAEVDYGALWLEARQQRLARAGSEEEREVRIEN